MVIHIEKILQCFLTVSPINIVHIVLLIFHHCNTRSQNDLSWPDFCQSGLQYCQRLGQNADYVFKRASVRKYKALLS